MDDEIPTPEERETMEQAHNHLHELLLAHATGKLGLQKGRIGDVPVLVWIAVDPDNDDAAYVVAVANTPELFDALEAENGAVKRVVGDDTDDPDDPGFVGKIARDLQLAAGRQVNA